MITEPLKRGTKCYWKRGGGYSCAYFVSLNQMPIAPHAVKLRHAGQDAIAKDCEVFTETDKFKDKHALIIDQLSVIKNKAEIARLLDIPYSRVLNVNKQAKELGIIHEAKEKI